MASVLTKIITRWLVLLGASGVLVWIVAWNFVTYVPEVRERAHLIASGVGLAGVALLVGGYLWMWRTRPSGHV